MTETENTPILLGKAFKNYLDMVSMSRSQNTFRTYSNAINMFSQILKENKIEIDTFLVKDFSENYIIQMVKALNVYSPSTEQCYLTAIMRFYEFLASENIADINLPRVRLLVKQRSRRPGIRLPQFPKNEIEKMIENGLELISKDTSNETERLINLRDRAFLVTLADTGLRVHEACQLRRGDIDWNEGRAAIIGKGNQQAIIRFSKRSLRCIKDYLNARGKLDGQSGKSLQSLPIFSRHDKASGKFIKPISTTTGRQIVSDRVRECLGENAIGTITPHSFRHYFVTTILVASGNLKLAQELARHKNIAVTQRYSHLADDELDREYLEIFG